MRTAAAIWEKTNSGRNLMKTDEVSAHLSSFRDGLGSDRIL
jgi:hypothetical protein